MSKVFKRFVTLIIGIAFIITALLLNSHQLLRTILCILGIVLLTYSNAIERDSKKLFVPLFAIIFTSFMIATDYLVVCAFKRIPIFAYSIVTTDKNKVYNAIGYRVWKCNDDFKVDPLYKLGYYCSISEMSSDDINNILPVIISDFDAYKDSYIKISGKISKIVDNQTIYMETYTINDDKVNFDDSKRLVINFNIPSSTISKLKVNSDTIIAGKIDSESTEDGIISVRIIDSSFITDDSENDDSYNFSVEDNIYCKYDKELWFETDDNIYYKSCINDLNITLDNNEYNLMNAIKNKVITLNDLKNNASGYLTNSQDSSIIYTFNNFKLLVCDTSNSKDVIVGRNSMSFSDGYCKNITDNNEVGV